MDFIMNGQGNGSVAATLIANGFDSNVLRPYIGEDGQSYFTANGANGPEPKLTRNADALLRKDEWQWLDTAVMRVAKNRLQAAADLTRAGLTKTVPGGFGKTVYQYQRMSDINPAIVSMEGVRQGDRDQYTFDIVNHPLPLIHKDFSFTARQIAESRQSGAGLDTMMPELATRQVLEEYEKLIMGTSSYSTQKFAGSANVPGYTNYSNRITYTITQPTAAGWTPAKTVQDVLAMLQLSRDNFYYGPWMLYFGTSWSPFLDDDYSAAYNGNTLLTRLRQLQGVSGIGMLDYLTGYQILAVQMTSEVVCLLNYMPLRVLQWETHAGMIINFKVVLGSVPLFRADKNNNTGLVHGS